MNYYNDNDKGSCAWLRELIASGLLPAGDVDCRSILDIQASDLEGYAQCHFFAGIGGWSRALRLAGWPDDRPVWTGSCPCQPLSCAGQRIGHADERHLWPAFYRLIAECRPPVVFGEQVAGKDGREWLAAVRADLEGAGYACGGADLCAAGAGAPHIRQRLYWVADSQCRSTERQRLDMAGTPREVKGEASERGWIRDDAGNGGATGGMGDSDTNGHDPGRQQVERTGSLDSANRQTERPSFWSNYDLIPCRDGKARRVEPSIFPLAHGVSGRVGLLRGAGNSIVPQVAAEFISAFLETGMIGIGGLLIGND